MNASGKGGTQPSSEGTPRSGVNESTKSFIAGLSAGMASTVAGYPPDTIKVRLQTQPLAEPRYKNAMHCLFKMLREEGPFSLFRGMSTPLFSRAVINAISFSSYTQMLSYFHGLQSSSSSSSSSSGNKNGPSITSVFMAGGCAGAISALIAGPTELIKVQLQVAGSSIPANEGPIVQARRVFRSLGWRGMFIGLLPTILRDFLCLGTFFATTVSLNRLISSEYPAPSPTLSIITGAMGGIAGWTVCYPLDLWKSNVQNFVPGAVGRSAPMLRFFMQRYSTQGIRSLYSGLATTLFRAGPVNGAKFFTFEAVVKMLSRV